MPDSMTRRRPMTAGMEAGLMVMAVLPKRFKADVVGETPAAKSRIRGLLARGFLVVDSLGDYSVTDEGRAEIEAIRQRRTAAQRLIILPGG